MTVYRIAACKYINDLSGEGAFRYGARWNSPGTRMLYTAESSALAMLEALAHVTMLPLKQDYCMVRLSIPDSVEILDMGVLPHNWNALPAPDSLRSIGTRFIAEGKALALKVPSVLVPDNFNFLINPTFPLFASIKVVAITNISFDQRLIKPAS
ncbi:MAG TPA: RES family NAD+ phosphorylase [Phnomibacter sp.]|nr:RES family NAD+ phosphorylase [Phnomibacter sp.]